jgi:hypothetical protein
LSTLPVGILAGAFVAIATTAAQAESARVAASPSSADPVQLVPAEVGETPPVVPQAAASAQPQAEEPAPVEPQVAQSDEGDAKAEVEQEPEAFPPETLTDRAGIETLSDVVRYAVLNHPAVKQTIATKKGSEFAVDEEYAGYLPSVDLSARGGWEHTDSRGERAGGGHEDRSLWNSRSSLTVDQPLFTGFQTVERVAAARHTVVGNTRLISANAEDIALGAIQAYLDVQRNREFVSIAEKNVQVHIDILEKVKSRAARIGVQSDVDQAEGRLALANALLEQRRQGLRDAESVFQSFVGLFPGNLSTTIDPGRIPELDLQSVVNQAVRLIFTSWRGCTKAMSVGEIAASTRSESLVGTISIRACPGWTTPPMVETAISLMIPSTGDLRSVRSIRSSNCSKLSVAILCRTSASPNCCNVCER